MACENGTVRLWEWDPSQGETKRTEDNGNTKAPLVLNEPVSRVIFDFDEKLLAVLTGDPLGENRGKGGAYLCELRPRKPGSELYDLASPKPLKGHEGPVVDAAFSQDQDGKLLATACKDGRVRVYSAPTACSWPIRSPHHCKCQKAIPSRSTVLLLTDPTSWSWPAATSSRTTEPCGAGFAWETFPS